MPGPQNKTVTVTASTAAINNMAFHLQPDNVTIICVAQGSCSETDGSTLSNSISFTLSGAALTTIQGIMTGAVLTRWRTVNGIEAP